MYLSIRVTIAGYSPFHHLFTVPYITLNIPMLLSMDNQLTVDSTKDPEKKTEQYIQGSVG